MVFLLTAMKFSTEERETVEYTPSSQISPSLLTCTVNLLQKEHLQSSSADRTALWILTRLGKSTKKDLGTLRGPARS
uniref:Uncharacterized protein n=1 Tax=Anguilla anguilla TaxID=7936 RepID=A0A0E9Q6S9_ANGAN